MFLVRRKADGKWWANNNYRSRRPWAKPETFEDRNWLNCPDNIKPFKTKGACKHAMYSFCYERTGLPPYKWVKDPTAFDRKFEIVPVLIKIGGSE